MFADLGVTDAAKLAEYMAKPYAAKLALVHAAANKRSLCYLNSNMP